MRAVTKDLFGKPLRRRRSRIEAALARYDEGSFPKRVERNRWLERIYPRNYILALPPETCFVFREAQNCFVDGHFIAALVLSTAFIEHILTAALVERGFEKESRGGMRSILRCLEANHSPLRPILGKIDHLQDIRNPFVHLKPYGHSSNLLQRSMDLRKHDREILEEDGRLAISVMFTVAKTRAW